MDTNKPEEITALLKALDQSQAMIEFDTDGIILSVNDNFIKTLGYRIAEEIIGKHHRVFCDRD